MEQTLEIRLDEAEVARKAEHVSKVVEQLGTRLDANESIFLARELEFIEAKEHEVDYPELKARKLIPIDTAIDPGAETFTYTQYDMLGAAKVITDYAQDLPSFDALAKQFTGKIVPLGGSFSYSIQELRAAAMAGRSLEVRKQRAASWGMQKGENNILLLGSSLNGIVGFLKADSANGGNVPTVTIPNDGTGSSKTWATKTADQLLRDLSLLLSTVREQTKGIHNATTILLPLTSWGVINSKPYSTTGGSDKTVLAWFLANNPGVEIDWLNELETAGTGGVKRAMAYVRNPDVVQGKIPQPYEQLPPQPKGLKFLVPCHSRVGGCAWYKPMAAVYGDGI